MSQLSASFRVTPVNSRFLVHVLINGKPVSVTTHDNAKDIENRIAELVANAKTSFAEAAALEQTLNAALGLV